jgi:SMODS and SLOG-associating 2TM effector domain 1
VGARNDRAVKAANDSFFVPHLTTSVLAGVGIGVTIAAVTQTSALASVAYGLLVAFGAAGLTWLAVYLWVLAFSAYPLLSAELSEIRKQLEDGPPTRPEPPSTRADRPG